MDQDKTYILLAKFIAGEATPEELEQLEWAFLANPELRKMVEMLPGWRQSPPKGMSTEDEQKLLQRGLEKFARLTEKPSQAAPTDGKPLFILRAATGDPMVNSHPPVTDNPISSDDPTVNDETTVNNNLTINDDPTVKDGPAIPAIPAPPPRTRRLITRWMMAAASVAIVVIGSVLYFHAARPAAASRTSPAIIAAARGTRRFMKLPDGSQLWLNAGSRIIIDDEYAAGENGKRELTLEGEAYFDVKHDPLHPFIIHTGRLEVKVLGTTLNIKAYPGDSSVETTLINGKVEIAIAGDSLSSIILHPNEKVIIPTTAAAAFPTKKPDSAAKQLSVNTTVNFIRRPVVPDRTDGSITETSWVQNKLVFRQQTLAGLATQLERWYDVKIVFNSDRYKRDTISGTFPNVPITDVMHALQITAGFHYRIDRDTVRIW